MTQIVSIGQLVADRFRIVRFIAEGGMGEVYEAQDTALGERVALKFLNRRSIGDERAGRRFRREIQLARKVTHHNVCRLHDLSQHTLTSGLLAGREVAFVTMELLEGETLEDLLTRDGPMREKDALPLILQMADALSAAHTAGIIHRDFKASNVVLVPSESDETGLRVVVTDFGLARATVRSPEDARNPLTGETSIVGTADYMSPEQLYGNDTSPASDVYALGVVIFEMVTGKKPYTASNPMSLLAKRVSEPPASPRDFVHDLDQDWSSVILDCLKTDPAERLATPREVVLALAGEDGIFAGQPSGVVRLPADFRRDRKGSRAGHEQAGHEQAEHEQAGHEQAGREQAGHEQAGREQAGREQAGSEQSAPRAGIRYRGLIAATIVLATLAGLAFWDRLGNRLGPAALSRLDPLQLTTSPGLELDPTLSPDGNALAFSSDQGGTFEIYLRDLTPGGRRTQLTADGGQSFEPAFSPDGKTIAFHSKNRGGIWLIPATGGTPRRLTRNGSRPAWSPDGKTLAFQSESSPQISDTTAPALAVSTLWLVAKDGTGRRQLTHAGQPVGAHAAPAFSPDGRRIVFSTSQRAKSEIWSIAVDSGDPILMAREPSAGFDPIYAADGHGIFFSARAREINTLWQLPLSRRGVKPAGPAVRVDLPHLASIHQLAISVDGSKMAFAAMETTSNLWSLPINPKTAEPAGEPVPLTRGTGRNNRPAFSPDGRRIAFDRWQHGLNVAIWVMGSGGADMRQLTVDPWSQTQPSWLPAGKGLGFQSHVGGQRIYSTIDLESGHKEVLTALDTDVDWARLSPDGTRLAFHSRGQGLGINLWLMDLADGSRRQLTGSDELMGFPCWSPDGQWLAFQSKQGESSYLMVLPAAGGEPTRLTTEAGQNWPFSFSPDSERIAFAALRDGEWSLWWVSRLTGKQQRLTGAPRSGAYVRYPAWSPLGDHIVYELAETTGDIWLVGE